MELMLKRGAKPWGEADSDSPNRMVGGCLARFCVGCYLKGQSVDEFHNSGSSLADMVQIDAPTRAAAGG